MKKAEEINSKQLTELLGGGRIIDALDVCRIICDYYSKYEPPICEGYFERSKMAALSYEGRKIYSRLSLGWEERVPYKKIANFSMVLDFEVLVFATSWDRFSSMMKRIENLGTKCTVKVFAVKRRGEDWDNEIILQLIDWIENDTVPEWKEEVKYKTIPR